MTDGTPEQSGLPALAEQIAGIPKAFIPATLKALDRLIGGAIDIPAAWLKQQKVKIDTQTDAIRTVESAVATAAAAEAAADPEVVKRATSVLLRKTYRRQINREAVGAETIRELCDGVENTDPSGPAAEEPDDEWLNVFERYAEEASTERMQKLWGRVLAGEIRNRGSYSMRTLRFLSEFSQQDALAFAQLCQNVFADCVPKALVIPEDGSDIRHLLSLQAADLIDGIDGLGLQLSLKFDDNGFCYFREDNLILLLSGDPGNTISVSSYTLTPIGKELINLLDRDRRSSARNVARAIRTPQIKAAHLAISTGPNELFPIEVLWTESDQ